MSSGQGHGFSPTPSRQGSLQVDSHIDEDPDRVFDFPPATSPFRGALEYDDPEQRKHKRRDSYFPEAWNPMKWLSESPRETPQEEQPQFDFSQAARTDSGHRRDDSHGPGSQPGPSSMATPQSIKSPRLRISRSMPQIQSEAKSPSTPKWTRLKSLLPHIAGQAKAHPPPSSTVAPANVNITDELITGGLATLMLRLWFERDERGHRRVPALMRTATMGRISPTTRILVFARTLPDL